ncbi:MAG: hypothetical protein MR021_00535 [Clostridiales bacterium]|nr:hypothetical protein [Clostridiales bacterium]
MKKLRTLFTAGLALVCAAALCLSLVALSDWTFTGRLDALPAARADDASATSSPLPTDQNDAADTVPLLTPAPAQDTSAPLLSASSTPVPADASDAMRIVSGLAGASHTAEPPAYLMHDQLYFYNSTGSTITRTDEEWRTVDGTLLDNQEAGDASMFVARAANLCADLLETDNLPENYVCQAAWDGSSILKCVWYPQDLSLREAQGEPAPLRYTLYVHTDEFGVQAVMDNFVTPQESLPQAFQEDIAEQLRGTALTGAWEITQVTADGTGAVCYTVQDQAHPENARTVRYQRNESNTHYFSDTQKLLSYYRALADRNTLLSTASGRENVAYVNLRLLMNTLLTEAELPLTVEQEVYKGGEFYRAAPITLSLTTDGKTDKLPNGETVTDGILSDLELKARFLFYHTAGFHPIVENTHFSMELHTVEDQLQVLCKWEALEAGVTCSLFCTLPDVQQAESGIPADMTASVQFPPLCVKELTNDTLTLLFSKAMENVVAKDNDMSNGILLSYTSGSLQLEGIKLSPKEGSVSAEVYYDDKNCTVFPIAAADFDDYQIASMARYLAQAIMTPNAAQ